MKIEKFGYVWQFLGMLKNQSYYSSELVICRAHHKRSVVTREQIAETRTVLTALNSLGLVESVYIQITEKNSIMAYGMTEAAHKELEALQ